MALQPDIDILLHIVAPEERQQAVLDQIQRPVFSLLETGPLSSRCSLIVYDDIRELAGQANLSHMRDTIVDEYTIFARRARNRGRARGRWHRQPYTPDPLRSA